MDHWQSENPFVYIQNFKRAKIFQNPKTSLGDKGVNIPIEQKSFLGASWHSSEKAGQQELNKIVDRSKEKVHRH